MDTFAPYRCASAIQKYFSRFTAILLLIYPLAISGSAFAQTNSLGVIADTGTPIPEGIGQFSSFSEFKSLGNNLDVVFTGSSQPQQAIYTNVGGSLVLVADSNTAIPGGTGKFTSFSTPVSLGEGNLVFLGVGSGQEGIYTFINGTISAIVDLNTPIPGGSGNFDQGFLEPVVSPDNSDIFFIGFGSSSQRGIYKFSSGSISAIVDKNTEAPGFGNFNGFNSLVSLGGDNIAFIGSVSGEDGIYTIVDGALELKVDHNTPYPGGTGNFTHLDGLVSLGGSDIGFRGSSDSLTGLFAIIGDLLTVVADTSTTAPGGAENFRGFDFLVSLGGSNAVFRGATDTQIGIYSFISGTLAKVADFNTPIPGGSGNFTDVFNPTSIGGSDIAFEGHGSGFQSGVYTYINGNFAVVADTSTPIPGGTGNFTNITNIRSLGGGNLAFIGFGSDQSGIYTFINGTIELVADLTTPTSGGSGHFTEFFDITSLAGGELAFLAYNKELQKGIYTFIDGTLELVADLNTPIPGGSGNFTDFISPISLDGGNVAFLGTDSSGQRGIYTFINETLAVAIDKNTPIPGGTGNFATMDSPVSLGGGNIAFRGQGSIPQSGIYAIINGSVLKVADKNTPIPGGTGNFTGEFHIPVSLGDGDVAFSVEDQVQPGIYAYVNGALSAVADRNTTIPGDTGTFTGFGDPVSIGEKDIAFTGVKTEFQGTYTLIGGSLSLVADINTPIPGGTGNFTGFDIPISLDTDDIAFWGFGSEQNGIYTFIDEVLDLVADNNTELPDGTGFFFSFSTPVSLGGGNIAFMANAHGDSIYKFMNARLSLVVDRNTSIPGGFGNFDIISSPVSLGEGVVAFGGEGFLQEGLYYKLNTGSLTIVKETDPDGTFGFGFTGSSFPPGCDLDGSFTLGDDQFIDCDLLPGEYTVEETDTQGFTLTNINCVGDSTFSTTQTSVTVNLEANDNMVCTFTNTSSGGFSLNVNLLGSGNGNVISSTAGINCPGDCSNDYPASSMIELNAVPDAISDFSGWGGDCSGAGLMTTVTVDADKTCTATFTLKQFTVNVVKIGTGTGTVTSAPGGINCGTDCSEAYTANTVVNLTPSPGPESNFAGWTGDPDCSDGAVTVDSDTTCTAIFNLNSPPSESADISVVKSGSPDPVEVGGELTYSISVHNEGPDDAPGTILTDILPSGLTFVSASDGCTNNNGTIICDLGNIPEAGTRNINIVVIPAQPGIITNSAVAGSDAFDPDTGNNTSTINTEVGSDTAETLTIMPNSESTATQAGGLVSISVEINNPDTAQTNSAARVRQTATGVVFAVDLPEGFTPDELTATQGTCDIEALECVIGDILPGETVTVVVNAFAPQRDGAYNVSFIVSTLTGQTFTGNTTVVVTGSGDDSGNNGGCSVASRNTGGTDLLGLCAPLMLLPLAIILRRNKRRS